jgi:hypothetical protein
VRPLALALVLCLPLAARAQEAPPPAAPAASGLIESVEVGFDGAAVWRVPAPVWVTLVNGRDREVEVKVVAKSALATVERAVTLPAGSRKRVFLALVLEDQLLVELREGGRTSEERLLPFETTEPERHALVLDGRPKERRTGATSGRDDQTLRWSTIAADSAPLEPSCYAAFGGVLLREADPGAWSVDQREALLEWVREGGLLLLANVTGKDPLSARFFEGLPGGPVESQKLVGRAARARRVGLGRVVAFSDDPLLAAAGGPQAADVKQRLGDLLGDAHAARRWPRPHDELDDSPLEGPGVATQSLVIGFVLAYFLAVGPILGFALRRARRERLALVTVALVLGFTVLAPVVAGLVRTGHGEARHRALVGVPVEGPALELGEVIVVSGGATAYQVQLSGGQVAATVLEGTTPRDYVYRPNGWVMAEPRPTAVRTSRGEQVAVDVSMPPWGSQRILTLAERADVKRLDATLRRSPEGAVAEIFNDTGAPLEDAIIVEEVQGGNVLLPYLPVGTIAPGERRTVQIPRGLPTRRPPWHEVLDVPGSWTSWMSIGAEVATAQQGARGGGPRYRLVSRCRARARVSGSSLTTIEHALRVDPFRAEAPRARGFLGVYMDEVDQTVQLRPLPGGPSEKAGVLEGDVVVDLEGEPIHTAQELVGKVQLRAPGDPVRLRVRGRDGAVRELTVILARAPGAD